MANAGLTDMRVHHVKPGGPEGGPSVILASTDLTSFLPVWVNEAGADAIAAALAGKKPSDDSPYGLLAKSLTHLDVRLDHVLLWSHYGFDAYFKLGLAQDGKQSELEVGENEALALSVERGIPVRVGADFMAAWGIGAKEGVPVRGSRSDAEWVLDLMRVGYGCYELERWNEAHEAFAALVAFRPWATDHLRMLAIIELKLGHYRKALALCQQALAVVAEHGNPWAARLIGQELDKILGGYLDRHFLICKAGAPFTTAQAPALIEDFEERGPSHQWISDWYESTGWASPGGRVTAPGGREGHAYRLTYDFAAAEWPMFLLVLDTPHTWTGAGGLALDVFVEPGDSKASTLRLVVCVGRMRGRYEHQVDIKTGWNALRLPFDGPGWRRTISRNETIPADRVDLAAISPVDAMTFMLLGTGQKDRGSIYFDNIRIE